MTDRTTEMLALADYFDEIEVDENGLCKWTDVANAQTHLRAELRASGGAYVEGQRDMQERAKAVADDLTPGKFEGTLAAHVTGRRIAAAVASLPLEAQESDGRSESSLPLGESEPSVTLACRPSDTPTSGDAVRSAFDNILNRIYVFREHSPEEDETWESWYYAAFDMLSAEVRQIQKETLSALKPEAAPAGEVAAYRWKYKAVPEMKWQFEPNKTGLEGDDLIVEPLYATPPAITEREKVTRDILRNVRPLYATPPAGEVVAWQRRLKKHHADEWSDWHPCSKEQAEYALLNGGPRDYENHLWAEVRPLYATPPAITEREKVTRTLEREEKYLLEHIDADCGIMPGDVEGSFHRLRAALDGGDR